MAERQDCRADCGRVLGELRALDGGERGDMGVVQAFGETFGEAIDMSAGKAAADQHCGRIDQAIHRDQRPGELVDRFGDPLFHDGLSRRGAIQHRGDA